MLLQKWVDFFNNASQRNDRNQWVQSPPSYIPTAIRFLIKLDAQGEYQGLVATSSGRKKDRGKFYAAPHVLVTSGPEPKLLVGNCEYVLGQPRDPKKDGKKVFDRHNAFIAEVEKCAQETDSPHVKAVLNFLTSETPKTLVLPDDFASEDLFTFEVEGVLVINRQEVQKHWFFTQKAAYESGGSSGQCIVCGSDCHPGKAHPIQMKGIPGGQTSGMAIVSANKDAFYSYELKNSLLSPTCWDCAERYAKAYYVLREKEDSHLVVGPLVYLFWTRQETGFNIATLFSQPQPDQVKQLLRSAHQGRSHDVLDTQAFYATALSASGGRVVVRDWLEITVGEVKEHLSRWFSLQNIVDWDGSEGAPYGVYALAASLVRDPRRDLPPNTPRILLKIALQGGRLPSWLMFQAIKRNRAEQQLTRPRAALIKMALLSQLQTFQEDAMVRLNEENLNPAYLCGRLLAVLEQVQFQAVSPKATLIDRFFGTASTAPASVFPRLVRGAQPHLGKLRKEKFGAYVALQDRMEGVMANLAGFPKVLSLEEQGWFSLGYYHQRAWDRAQAKAKKESGDVETEPEDSTPEQE